MKEIKDIAMWEETDSELAKYTIGKLQQENELFKDRIDKAIDYCEEITSREIDISDTDYDLGQDFMARDILKILRGKDNE